MLFDGKFLGRRCSRSMDVDTAVYTVPMMFVLSKSLKRGELFQPILCFWHTPGPSFSRHWVRNPLGQVSFKGTQKKGVKYIMDGHEAQKIQPWKFINCQFEDSEAIFSLAPFLHSQENISWLIPKPSTSPDINDSNKKHSQSFTWHLEPCNKFRWFRYKMGPGNEL